MTARTGITLTIVSLALLMSTAQAEQNATTQSADARKLVHQSRRKLWLTGLKTPDASAEQSQPRSGLSLWSLATPAKVTAASTKTKPAPISTPQTARQAVTAAPGITTKPGDRTAQKPVSILTQSPKLEPEPLLDILGVGSQEQVVPIRNKPVISPLPAGAWSSSARAAKAVKEAPEMPSSSKVDEDNRLAAADSATIAVTPPVAVESPADDQGKSEISPRMLGKFRVASAREVFRPMLLGDSLFRAGRLEQAAEVYEMLMHREPSKTDRAWVLFQLGNCKRVKDPDGALGYYNMLLSDYPTSQWSHVAQIQKHLLEWNRMNKPHDVIKQAAEDAEQRRQQRIKSKAAGNNTRNSQKTTDT